jgi:3-oxoacyl-[acyl-carrier protein] reductase
MPNPPAPTRTAVITGASHGIGAAVAERLAHDGLAVVINYSGSAETADQLVTKIEASGGRAIAVKADVSDPLAVKALFDAAEQAFGGVDVLVNNAGIMTLSPIATAKDEVFDRMIAVNLKGVFNGLREAGRRMRDDGRVVSFSSSVVGLYQPGYALYAATKAAVEAMTHIFAKEVGARRITVNAVAPGPVDTPLFTDGKTPDLIAQIARSAPSGRLGAPEDIARVVAFLVSPDGAWVNGQVLRVNGGVI